MTPDALTFALALVSACTATWGASRWWYGRQLEAAQFKIDKLNHAHVLCDQHTAQTRRQIEHLNRELTTYRAREQWSPAPLPPPAAPVAPAAPSVAMQAAAWAPARTSVADLARLLDAGDRWREAQQPGGWQATRAATRQVDEQPAAPAVSRSFANTLPMELPT